MATGRAEEIRGQSQECAGITTSGEESRRLTSSEEPLPQPHCSTHIKSDTTAWALTNKGLMGHGPENSPIASKKPRRKDNGNSEDGMLMSSLAITARERLLRILRFLVRRRGDRA